MCVWAGIGRVDFLICIFCACSNANHQAALVSFLVSRGASTDLKNGKGETPADLCSTASTLQVRNHHDCIFKAY